MVERTLYPVKTWLFIRFAAVAALALLPIVATGGPYGGKYGPIAFFVHLALVLFFAVQLLPGAVYLKLTREGFEYKNVLPARFVKWSDVEHFTTYRWRTYADYVGWVYSDLASVGFSANFFTVGLVPRAMSRLLRLRIDDGFTVNFGLKNADTVARLLEEWRQKYDGTTRVSMGNPPK
jgi:hypothetical protein